MLYRCKKVKVIAVHTMQAHRRSKSITSRVHHFEVDEGDGEFQTAADLLSEKGPQVPIQIHV
jgi:hypothetical protein